MVKEHLSVAPVQVQFVCPKCNKALAWAFASTSIKCPGCGTWVNDKNRKRECEVYLPADSEQTVLFIDKEDEDA
ncbi:MAG: hypothetical protein Q4D21_09700 [Phascolarctobacterium sp.]|nr:hypothetical protein [Phascolarctobacterium sp.]